MRSVNKFLVPIFLCAFALGGCSSFSKTGRQKHAYEKYVRRSSITRARQQSHFHSDKPQMPVEPMPSEPVETTETGGPQSVPRDN